MASNEALAVQGNAQNLMVGAVNVAMDSSPSVAVHFNKLDSDQGGGGGATEKEEEAALAVGDEESGGVGGESDQATITALLRRRKGKLYWALMAASSAALVLGLASATLLGRLYFVNGGSRRWVYTWIESAGWPILIPPLLLSYYLAPTGSTTVLTPPPGHARSQRRHYLLLAATFLAMGSLTALDNLLYSWGMSFLPVSTNSLLCSSQLAFNALFSFALVRQKLTPFTINSIFIITMGTLLLGFAEAERPSATTQAQYVAGYLVTILASALFALLLPLTQLVYDKIVGRASFARVLEVQLGVSTVASVISMAGMWGSGDFQGMIREAGTSGGGEGVYALTLVFCGVGWQLYLLGGAGIVFLASSLMSCVFMTAMIPVLPVLAVVFFHDTFSAVKGIAMLLSIWGFISYLYGGYLNSKHAKKISSIPP